MSGGHLSPLATHSHGLCPSRLYSSIRGQQRLHRMEQQRHWWMRASKAYRQPLRTRRFRMATVAWFEWIPRSSLPTSLPRACSPAYTPRAWQDFWVTVVAGRGGRPAPRGDACLLSESSEGIPVYSAKAARGCLSTQRKQRGDACLLSESNSSPRQRPLRGVFRSGGSQRPEKDWLASGDIRVS